MKLVGHLMKRVGRAARGIDRPDTELLKLHSKVPLERGRKRAEDMEVITRKVNGLRGRPPNTPLSKLRERFQAAQRKVIAEQTAAGHAVAALEPPSDWVLAAVRDELTLKALALAYTRPAAN
jgi:hypothetical protein